MAFWIERFFACLFTYVTNHVECKPDKSVEILSAIKYTTLVFCSRTMCRAMRFTHNPQLTHRMEDILPLPIEHPKRDAIPSPIYESQVNQSFKDPIGVRKQCKISKTQENNTKSRRTQSRRRNNNMVCAENCHLSLSIFCLN